MSAFKEMYTHFQSPPILTASRDKKFSRDFLFSVVYLFICMCVVRVSISPSLTQSKQTSEILHTTSPSLEGKTAFLIPPHPKNLFIV